MISAGLSTDAVLVTIVNGAATLTLNRAEKGNRLDAEMFTALVEAMRWLAARDFRALLLRAKGPMFCVGGAIDSFQQVEDLSGHLARDIPVAHDFIRALDGLEIPVISAVQGAIAGAGVGIALCADIVVASETMILRGGYLGIGLTPDFGTSWRLARQAGPLKAAEILMTNRPVSAQECLDLQLVTMLTPPEDLDARANAMLKRLANGPTLALKQVKKLIAAADAASLDEHLDQEERYIVASSKTEDAREGINAFLQKRQPGFTGS